MEVEEEEEEVPGRNPLVRPRRLEWRSASWPDPHPGQSTGRSTGAGGRTGVQGQEAGQEYRGRRQDRITWTGSRR